jgi:endonuclease/exonuclease/phosphatase family metal-dependent hydrolase
MRLITWNIQCGKGSDGVVDLARIVSTARSMADADIFCFQEVSDGFANLDGGTDQSAQLPRYCLITSPYSVRRSRRSTARADRIVSAT